MAITVFKAIWAFGHKTTVFLQSLFLFPFYAIPQALGLFPGFRQTNHQPTLPFSNSRFASSSSTETRHHDDEMPNASSGSNMVPALPRTAPPGPGKENRVLEEKALSTKTADDDQLADKFSRLELGETGKSATASQDPFRDTVNGAGSSIADDGTGKQAAQDSTTESTVTRAVPVSQSSKPKEAAATTIQLDGVTVQVQAKAETPEQAAQRAMHSRFMREALDMVSLGFPSAISMMVPPRVRQY